jgi:hypothetical protein
MSLGSGQLRFRGGPEAERNYYRGVVILTAQEGF